MVNVEIDATFNPIEVKEEVENKYDGKWVKNPMKFIVEQVPLHLDLELNNTCNLKCVMCFQSFDPPFPQELGLARVIQMIDEFAQKGGYSIKFNYRGEPLLYKYIADVVKYANGKGLETMINTNGTRLKDQIKPLLNAGLDKIIFSIDSVIKEKYEAIRVGGKFEMVLANLLKLEALKQLHGYTKPLIRIQGVIVNQSEKDIEIWKEFWSFLGKNWELSMVDCKDYRTTTENWMESDFCCAQLWQRLIVRADGKVQMCCGAPNDDKIIGDIHETNLAEIWHCKALNDVREKHKKGLSHEIKACRVCDMRNYSLRENTKKKEFKY